MNITNTELPKFTVPDAVTNGLSEREIEARTVRIKQLLVKRQAVLIAHYYTDPTVQRLAEESGGFIGDSLAMARFGREHPAKTLLVAGVRFMGESAKILSRDKTILMPTLKAECSLDLGCPALLFKQSIKEHPGRKVVVYANTSAEVKALADWVVTSSNAISIVRYLQEKGEKILWAPDRFLGGYIQKQTGADMVLWQGSCIVHEEFKAKSLKALKQRHPEAAVLVHPESPTAVVEMADVVGSTARLLSAVSELPNNEFIVATDRGIFYKMQQAEPDKVFIEAPTGGEGATCRSCAHCPWMSMNQLDNIESTLIHLTNEVKLPDEVIDKALLPLTRMVEFNETRA